MAFQKYQGEQVQQIPGGYVEAMGSVGKAYQQFGASVSAGMQEAQKRADEEAKLIGALSPYIKADQRTQDVERFLQKGIFTKAEDGSVVVSANWADKVNMEEVNKTLSFYNSTGGDGSKLSGASLRTFAAMYEGEQKYASDQASRAAAKIDADLKNAQIAELKAKTAERMANSGLYGSALTGMGFNAPTANIDSIGAPTSQALGVTNTTPTLTPPTTPKAAGSDVKTVPMVDTTISGVASPTGQTPEQKAAETAATYAKPTAPATAPGAAPGAAPAATTPAPAAKPAEIPKAPAPKAAAPAAPAAAPAAPATAATAAAPAAPTKYDIPKKAAEVTATLKSIEEERTNIQTKYSSKRTEAERQITRTKATMRVPANSAGLQLATATLKFHEDRLKDISEAEARDLRAVDDKVAAVNRDFAAYQAAATSVRQDTESKRIAEKDAAAVKNAAAEESRKAGAAKAKAVQDYPIMGVWTHMGYKMKNAKTGELVEPADFGIAPLTTQQKNDVNTSYDGMIKAQDFLLRLKDTLRSRSATNNEWSQRFRLTASDMQNYFEGELASTFGVATFRRAIVSGGNFSDADREFVKKAITYLNTAAPDMSQSDLESSTNALAIFINAMYSRSLQSQGMIYNPEETKKQIADLRSIGADTQADALDANIAETERFHSTYNIKPTGKSNLSPEEKTALLKARETLWTTLKKAGDTKGVEGSDPARFKK